MTNAQRFTSAHPEIFGDFMNPFTMVTAIPNQLPDGKQRVRCADTFGWNEDTDVIVDFYFEEGTINPRGKDEHVTHVAIHRVYLDGSWDSVQLCDEELDALRSWIETNILKWR